MTEPKVKKGQTPKKNNGSFAEAMKQIEEVRKRDAAKEILRINKKISVDRLHEDLRNSVRNASDRLDDEAIEKIKSKISSAEAFAENLLNSGKKDESEVGGIKVPANNESQEKSPIEQDPGKLPSK